MEGGGAGGRQSLHTHQFLEQKIFFHVKSKNNIFKCE